MRVALLPTCLVDTVAPEVGMATVRVLRRLGMEVDVPRKATCCGQPAWNAGFAQESAKVARTTLRALSEADADVVCVPAGSCAAMMRVFWPELFHLVGDEESVHAAQALAPRIKEFSELVGEADGEYAHKVAYHHSCHMLRELGIRDEPEQALDAVGAERVTWLGDDRCCGFGGLFSMKQPETSVAMADDKADSLACTEAEVLVGCDQSCLMHLEGRLRRRGSDLPVRHLAEVLDEAAGE